MSESRRLKYVAVAEGCGLTTWEEIARVAEVPPDTVVVERTRLWTQQCEVYVVASEEFRELYDFDLVEQYAAIGRNGTKLW